MPKSKRRNAVLRLYDGPVYRDWAFWLTASMVLLGALSMATSDQPSTLPKWLDTLLGTVVIGGLFGVLPTWLRLLFRRWWWRRKVHAAESVPRTSASLNQQAAMPAPIAGRSSYLQQAPAPQPIPPVAFRVPQPAPAPIVTPPPLPLPLPLQVVPPAPPQVVAHHPVTEPAVLPTRAGILVVARDSLPHPAARAVRVLQQAHDARDQYEAVLVAAETLAITLSVTAAALLNDRQQSGPGHTRAGHQELSALRSAYLGKGVMFGTWTSWLGSLAPLLTAHPDLVPGLREAIADRSDTPGIVGHLNALRDERNRAAHGNKPHSRQEFMLRIAQLTPHLETALNQARFLEDIPWLLTISSSFQPRSNSFQVVARRAMGDHPDFETRTFTWSMPVADEVFYVLGPSGPLSLSPFVASRFCGHCSQLEVCYAYKTGKQNGPATFKSFDSGHDIPADELGDDLRSLPDRNHH